MPLRPISLLCGRLPHSLIKQLSERQYVCGALLCWLLSHESAGGDYQGSDVGLCRKLSSMLAMTAAAASCSRNLYLSGLYSFVEGT